MNLGELLNFSTLLNTVNTATIVVLAGLGCLMTDQAGMMNIGIDGLMVVGAFCAVMASWFCQSWLAGIVFALLVCALFGWLYGLFVVRLHSDEFIIGVGFNIFAVAVTTFLLRLIPGQSGSFHPATGSVIKVPAIPIQLPGGMQVTMSVLVPASWLLTLLCYLMIYRTPFGFWLHASGEQPDALRAVGRSPDRMKYFASVACGMLCGLSGAYMSLGYLSTFSENMSDSRGYVAVACVIFGRANPLLVFLAAVLFGLIDAIGLWMQDLVSPTLTATFPYIGTILMMVALVLRQQHKQKKRAAAR